MPAAALLAVLLLGLLHPPPAGARTGSWTAPLDGARVLERFRFDPGAPYARGARRGVLLGAAAGAVVRAPCRGRVRFAGTLPDGRPAVSVRCGALVATLLGVAPRVPGGRAVREGAPLGVLGGDGRLHLGARRAAGRNAYRDPLALLGRPAARAPLAPRAPRGRGPAPGAPPAVPPRAVSARVTRARAGAPVAPPAAWAGAAVLACAAGAGIGLPALRRRAGRGRSGAAARRRPRGATH